MNFIRFQILFLFFPSVCFHSKAQQQDFNKAAFYKVLSSDSKTEVEDQLNHLKNAAFPEKNAYEGTILMKKAGLVAVPIDKLNLFKSGRLKLESAINTDRDNLEYRFLRIVIQEHAPKIVKYRNELEEDSKLINMNFMQLSPFLQQQITNYSKKSKFIKIPVHN